MAKKPFGWGRKTFPTVPELPTTSPDHPDADLPFADEIPDELIPLDWEERQQQEPRREKNYGAGEYQIPLGWHELGQIADLLIGKAVTGFSSSNIHAFYWTEATDKDHPDRLWVWFQPGRISGGAKRAHVQPGKIVRYVYDRVPFSVFQGMQAAGSKGTFLDAMVKKAGYLYHGPF